MAVGGLLAPTSAAWAGAVGGGTGASAPSASSPPSGPAAPSPSSPGVSQADSGFTGFVEPVAAITSSTAAFTVGAVTCGSGYGQVYFETSIYNPSTADESGVEVQCSSGVASYFVEYDEDGTFVAGPAVAPGDHFVAMSSRSGASCTASVVDITTSIPYVADFACPTPYTLGSSGVLSAAPPDFGAVVMTSVALDGAPIQPAQVTRRNSYDGYTLQATQGAYRTGSLTLTWVHS